MPRRPGDRNHELHRKAKVRDRVWQSMRIMRRFTVPDLIATAECSHANAIKYVRALSKVQIVRVAVPKRNGFKGGHQVYQLARDLGPVAPRIQSNGSIFNPNAHEEIVR